MVSSRERDEGGMRWSSYQHPRLNAWWRQWFKAKRPRGKAELGLWVGNRGEYKGNNQPAVEPLGIPGSKRLAPPPRIISQTRPSYQRPPTYYWVVVTMVTVSRTPQELLARSIHQKNKYDRGIKWAPSMIRGDGLRCADAMSWAWEVLDSPGILRIPSRHFTVSFYSYASRVLYMLKQLLLINQLSMWNCHSQFAGVMKFWKHTSCE